MELTLAILLALVIFIGVPAVIGCALVGFRAWCLSAQQRGQDMTCCTKENDDAESQAY